MAYNGKCSNRILTNGNMTDKEFCKIESALTGELMDKVEQLVSKTFTGRELKEYLEDVIELVKSDLLHSVSKCECCEENKKLTLCEDCANDTEWATV